MTDTARGPAGVPADLLEAAWAAHANAYVPYSRFPVGAALRTTAGHVFAGANVENASFGLTRCAEQSAVQAMVSAGEREFTELVVVSSSPEPATPCGACRQVLLELCAPETQVLMRGADGCVIETTVAALLPGGFQMRPSGTP